jgi:ribosomal protein S18 acetylase RimI-like enzyme
MVCYLEDIFVAPEARGRGAGRALIEKLVALGKEEGWRRIYWHTHEGNDRARRLYDSIVERTDYIRYDICQRRLLPVAAAPGSRDKVGAGILHRRLPSRPRGTAQLLLDRLAQVLDQGGVWESNL